MTVTTLRTVLRGIGRIHPYQDPPGPFCLEGKVVSELRPSRIVDTLSQTTVMHHSIDRQVFYGDNSVSIYNLSAMLVGEVLASISNAFMDSCGNLLFLLALRFRKGFLVGTKKAGVLNLFSGGKSGKGGQSYIDTYLIRRNRKRKGLRFTGDSDKPLTGSRTGDCAGFRDPLQGTMLLDSKFTNLRNAQSLSRQLPSRLWETKRVIPFFSTEPRITRILARFATTKEGFERQVNPHRHILQDLRMNLRQRRSFFFQFWQGVLLVIQTKGFFLALPGDLSLLQEVIIQPAAFFQNTIHGRRLFMGRIEAISKCFTHVSNICLSSVHVKENFVGS